MQKLRFIYTAVAVALVFTTGCRKNETENIFDKSVDERITEALANYQTTLTQAPGWKLFVYPAGLRSSGIEIGGFCYYVKFTDNNRATMVSDFELETMAATPKESGYVLKAFQRPSLVFDTYSYLHVAADPNGSISQTPAGRHGIGWGSDFNFSFTKVETGDTMILEGNQFSSEAVLVKATAGEIDSAFNKGSLKAMMETTEGYVTNNHFLYLPGGNNTKFALSFNGYYRMLKFYGLNDNNSLETISVPFSATTRSLWLKQPVTLGGYTFREIFWDSANSYFYILSNGNKVILSNDSQPTISFPVGDEIGKKFLSVLVPETPLYGQSSQFATAYDAAKTNIKNGGYNLDLKNVDFQFDDNGKRLTLNVYVAQNGALYLAQTIYSYTRTGDQLKFTFVSENQNAALIKSNMSPLMKYFAQDRFTINALSSTSGFLGQLTSVENPGFYFTGYLQ